MGSHWGACSCFPVALSPPEDIILHECVKSFPVELLSALLPDPCGLLVDTIAKQPWSTSHADPPLHFASQQGFGAYAGWHSRESVILVWR